MQEQELSVNDILSSIKQILSSKIEEEITQKSHSEDLQGFGGTPGVMDAQKVQAPIVPHESDSDEDVFVLTPDMQVEIDPNMTGLITDKHRVPLGTISTDKTLELMMPAVQKWIDENLPQMVERIVSEEVRRIFNTKNK